MIRRDIPERPGVGRLGRHIRHDPRSRRFAYPSDDLALLRSVRHDRHIPALDQGTVGSCTGHAAEHALACTPLLEPIPAGHTGRPTGDPARDGEQATALYSAATRLDEWDGQWPPDDTGSSGLAVAKACHRAGLISGYQHAFGLEAALTALASRPVIAGIGWYDSFDEPDQDGLISVTDAAGLRGGHEICLDELDVERRLVGFTNSWGPGWGLDGRAYMPWDTFGRLLAEQGDVTVLVPLSEPAPQPVPADPDRDCLTGFFGLVREGCVAVVAWLDRHDL